MDRVDQACIGQALEQAPAGQSVAWTNPDGGQYRVTPVRTYEAGDGRYCREYQTSAIIGGRKEKVYGTACRQPDGSWQVQS
jgi:surface antigen